jgi:hypothetical protein
MMEPQQARLNELDKVRPMEIVSNVRRCRCGDSGDDECSLGRSGRDIGARRRGPCDYGGRI